MFNYTFLFFAIGARFLIFLLIAFYLVLAFFLHRVRQPRLVYWAYGLLAVGLIGPLVGALASLADSSGSGIWAIAMMVLSPIALVSSVLVLTWSCVPAQENTERAVYRFVDDSHDSV